MDPQILIYINKLRKYFQSNRDARQYFLGQIDEDTFLDRVTDMATKNVYDKGDPTLSMKQFELIKKTLTAKMILERNYDVQPFIYIDKRGYYTRKKNK